MNGDFFLAILNAMNMGDLINDVGYQTRPYEISARAGRCPMTAIVRVPVSQP